MQERFILCGLAALLLVGAATRLWRQSTREPVPPSSVVTEKPNPDPSVADEGGAESARGSRAP